MHRTPSRKLDRAMSVNRWSTNSHASLSLKSAQTRSAILTEGINYQTPKSFEASQRAKRAEKNEREKLIQQYKSLYAEYKSVLEEKKKVENKKWNVMKKITSISKQDSRITELLNAVKSERDEYKSKQQEQFTGTPKGNK